MSFSLRFVIWFSALVLLVGVVDNAVAVVPLPFLEGPAGQFDKA